MSLQKPSVIEKGSFAFFQGDVYRLRVCLSGFVHRICPDFAGYRSTLHALAVLITTLLFLPVRLAVESSTNHSK